MSKFECSCGHIIRDNTDYLSYKGYYISDQDYFDFCDELETHQKEDYSSLFQKFARDIYQCSNCNNIFIFPYGNQFHEFKPLKAQSSEMLSSYKQNKWQGILRGHFISGSGKGEVYWETNQQHDFLTELNQEQVESTYHDKFNELYSLGILRSAFLRINGVIIHEYGE